MGPEASRCRIEQQQAVERPDPQHPVVVLEQGVAAVVDRDRGVDRIVVRAPGRRLHAGESAGMGPDPEAVGAVGQDALDVVREQRTRGHVELFEATRTAVIPVHAVVVGADPEALGRRILDDAAHRIVTQ